MKSPRQRWQLAMGDLMEKAEDGAYVLVAALLVIAAAFLMVSLIASLYKDLLARGALAEVTLAALLDFLDKGLILLIIAELLHTVRITLKERTLSAEPFVIVGLIAGIRRILILTAQSAQGRFQWNPEGIELLLLIGVVLVMTLAFLMLRRSAQPGSGSET